MVDGIHGELNRLGSSKTWIPSLMSKTSSTQCIVVKSLHLELGRKFNVFSSLPQRRPERMP
jgi:hypothetical protein